MRKIAKFWSIPYLHYSKVLVSFFVYIVLVTNCRFSGSSEHLIKPTVMLLDSTAATQAILLDTTEHFFDKITSLDMAIQMKKSLDSTQTRNALLEEYRHFLQKDVSTFTPDEANFIQAALNLAIIDCQQLFPTLLPPQIQLIKTNGRHYGDGVFYTRENRIILPENELQNQDPALMHRVMIHELFHLISRQHPDLRKQIYGVFGFKQTNASLHYGIPDSTFRNRILLNPDGIVRTFAMQIPEAFEDTLLVIPLLQSVARQYQPHLGTYFNYMNFGLYPLVQTGTTWQLRSTPLSPEQMQSFYQQIGDNTDYIIHPDEIAAENFTLLVLREHGKLNKRSRRLSPEGHQLLTEIQSTITDWTSSHTE